MTGLKKLLLAGLAGLGLLLASNSHAAYVTSEAGYHGSQVGANFRAISSTAGAFVADDGVTMFVLPFAFEFYGQTYAAGSSGWVSSNGLLGFDVANMNAHCCDGTLSFDSPTNTVVAGWFDMVGTVYTQTNGALGNRELIFTWEGNEVDSDAENLFQAILHEGSNAIEFQFDALNSLLHTTSVGGIKGDEATQGLNFIDFETNVSVANVGLLISTRQNVPEPGALVLLALGLAGIALARRQNRRLSASGKSLPG